MPLHLQSLVRQELVFSPLSSQNKISVHLLQELTLSVSCSGVFMYSSYLSYQTLKLLRARPISSLYLFQNQNRHQVKCEQVPNSMLIRNKSLSWKTLDNLQFNFACLNYLYISLSEVSDHLTLQSSRFHVSLIANSPHHSTDFFSCLLCQGLYQQSLAQDNFIYTILFVYMIFSKVIRHWVLFSPSLYIL